MKNLSRFAWLGLFLTLTAAACGGGGDNGGEIASVEITAPPDGIVPRAQQQLTAVARDADGNVVNGVTFAWTSENGRFLSLETDTATLKNQQTAPIGGSTVLATGVYPRSSVVVTALATAINGQSITGVAGTLPRNILAPVNNGQVLPLTDNNVEDNWGSNNNWTTTARDRVLWVENDGIDQDLIIADTDNNQTPLATGIGNIDFIGLGSDGFLTGGTLATWRQDLSNTFVDDGSATPDDLGAQTQEENAVADGFLFFREGLPNDDIWRFTLVDGLDEIFTDGQSKGPVMTSEGQAVWLQEDGALFDLKFYDGTNVVTVGEDLPFNSSFSLRRGRIVFSQGGDIFLYDSTEANPQSVNLTDSPADLENFAQTDGESVLIYRIAGGVTNQIVLHDIESGSEQIISTNTGPKDEESLQIDLMQAVWTEGSTDLFFFNGTSTTQVALGDPLSLNGYSPYVADGTVAWVANDGDDEIVIMK